MSLSTGLEQWSNSTGAWECMNFCTGSCSVLDHTMLHEDGVSMDTSIRTCTLVDQQSMFEGQSCLKQTSSRLWR